MENFDLDTGFKKRKILTLNCDNDRILIINIQYHSKAHLTYETRERIILNQENIITSNAYPRKFGGEILDNKNIVTL